MKQSYLSALFSILVICCLIGYGAGTLTPKRAREAKAIATAPLPNPSPADPLDTTKRAAMLAVGLALIPLAWPILKKAGGEASLDLRLRWQVSRALENLAKGWVDNLPGATETDIDVGIRRYTASASLLKNALTEAAQFAAIGRPNGNGHLDRDSALQFAAEGGAFLAVCTRHGALVLLDAAWKSNHVSCLIVGDATEIEAHILARDYGLEIIR